MRMRKGRLPEPGCRAHRLSMLLVAQTIMLALSCLSGVAAESKLNKLSLSTGKKSEHLATALVPKEPIETFKTVSAVMDRYGDSARRVWRERMNRLDKGMTYPPSSTVWICLKEEKQLLIFAGDSHGRYRCLNNYSIIGASGTAGPKLKEGDRQVPEGFYLIDGFRPNVIAHLGLSVNYPNQDDRKHARDEGRKKLGGDILIHGSRWSTGCLAMGNQPIEELFVLAHDTGIKNIELLFAPCNLLSRTPSCTVGDAAKIDSHRALKRQPQWVEPLYKRLQSKLKDFAADLP